MRFAILFWVTIRSSRNTVAWVNSEFVCSPAGDLAPHGCKGSERAFGCSGTRADGRKPSVAEAFRLHLAAAAKALLYATGATVPGQVVAQSGNAQLRLLEAVGCCTGFACEVTELDERRGRGYSTCLSWQSVLFW